LDSRHCRCFVVWCSTDHSCPCNPGNSIRICCTFHILGSHTVCIHSPTHYTSTYHISYLHHGNNRDSPSDSNSCSFAVAKGTFHKSELDGAYGLDLDECPLEDLDSTLTRALGIGLTGALVIVSSMCAFCVGWSYR